MAVSSEGYSLEMLYTIGEEVLGTTLYFQGDSNPNGFQGTWELANAFANTWPTWQELFGSNFTVVCIKTKPLGFAGGWGLELPRFDEGQGDEVCINEVHHLRLTLISEDLNGERFRNKNQLAGIDAAKVLNGRTTSLVKDRIQALFDQLVAGITSNGFTFFLAVRRQRPEGDVFLAAEFFQINPFVGTRIDRVRNRPNTGRKKVVAPPA